MISIKILRHINSFGLKASYERPVPGLGRAIASLLILAGVVMPGFLRNSMAAAVAAVSGEKGNFPQTLAELNAWYVEPPDGKNAAAFYLQGFDAMQLANINAVPFSREAQLPALGSAIPVAMKSALAAFVKSNQSALRLFAQGAKYDRCRYPVDLTLGYETLFPHAKKLGNATRLMELTAIYHAEADQGELAAKDVLIGLALANSLLEEPAVLAQLPRTWGVAYAVEALEQTINRAVLSEVALSELAKVLQKMEDNESRGEGFSRAMVGARVMALAALAQPQQLLRGMAAPDLKMSADRRAKITARLQKGEPLTAERKFFEESFQQLMAARKEAFPARLKSDDLGRQRVAEALEKKLVVLDLLLPSLGRRTAVEAECLAQLRLGATAVALEQFHAARGGRYPASLRELSPRYLTAIPADPFDGQPLRYQKKAGGYVLYSIGPDLVDDSGRPKSGKNGDLLFTVITPAGTPRQ